MTEPASSPDQRASFFRQSGWLMIANIAGGFLMYAVHLLNRFIEGGEYGSFVTFLGIVMVLTPTIPLQMVLAQQTAKALANHTERQLCGILRFLWLVTTLFWLAGALVVFVFQKALLERWQMSSAAGLWVTLLVVLISLWVPLFAGVLQGRQNFLWLGWSMMANAVGRVSIAALAVLVLHAGSAGMMIGVLLGFVAGFGIASWQTRALWLLRPAPFDWAKLLRQVFPLILAFLGFQILFTVDTLFVKAYFPKTTVDYYGSAGTLSRALMWLVLPLASVMFPRLVHSATKGEKSNLMNMVLIGTAVLSVVGAASLSLLGPWIVKLLYPKYVGVSSLLPWYVSAMVPLALANVLLNNLLARPASKMVLSLCVFVLSLGYMFALTRFHGSLVAVLQTMGVFNACLFLLCAWFSWGPGARKNAEE